MRPPLARAAIDWLLYAPGSDVLTALTRVDVRAHLVDSSRAFRTALVTEQPRVVLLAMPPGHRTDLGLLRQERRARPGMTALVLSDQPLDLRRSGFLADGIDATLPLHTRAADLVARFDLSRRGGSPDEATCLSLGAGLAVGTVLHELRRGEAVIHLRPREHALLLMLARQPGRVFTRRELLDGAWADDHHGDPRTVDVHVRWLREKLEADPSAPRQLLTVRGTGYRLVPGDDVLADR